MIGFIVAMKEEFDELGFIVSNPNAELCKVYDCENMLHAYKYIISGVGNINSAMCTQKLIDEGCTTIINLGTCGGKGKIGTIYNISRVIDGNIDLTSFGYSAFDNPYGIDNSKIKLIKYHGEGIVNNATLYSSDRFGSMPKSINAEVKDMEGLGIAQVCYKNNKQLLMLKIVTDNGETDSFSNNLVSCMQKLSVAIYEKLELIMKVDYDTYDKVKRESDGLYGLVAPTFKPVQDYEYRNEYMGSIKDKLK